MVGRAGARSESIVAEELAREDGPSLRAAARALYASRHDPNLEDAAHGGGDAHVGGLAGLLAGCRYLDTEALLEHIDSSVRGMQTGPPRDDVAMLAVRVEGTSADLSDIFSPPEGASAL